MPKYPASPSTSGNIITFNHEQVGSSPWDSQEEEEDTVNTSTPPFKRGEHGELSNEQIRDLIRRDGLWIHRIPPTLQRKRPHSIQLLADHHLKDWPIGDTFVRFTFLEHLPLSQWMEKIRAKTIIVNSRITVLYLQKLRHMMDNSATTLKNRIAQICRSIHAANADTRIFICDTLPPESNSELEKVGILKHNQLLFTATQHVNRELGRVFYLAMHPHFCDITGRVIEPIRKYMRPCGSLTLFGCMVFRNCLTREVGVTNYTME